jgi:CheY-like chemotaxis protein
VAYSIIKNHNGYTGLESHLGVGTRFFIYLPAFYEEIQIRRESENTCVVGKKKILVMDDEETIRKLAKETLIYIGYEVEFARYGAEALELYKKAKESNRPFDVVIMDLTIRGRIGGKERAKRLLESELDVKAIASSGYSNDPVMSEFKKFGFKGVIPKPYNVEDLKGTLYKVINEDLNY